MNNEYPIEKYKQRHIVFLYVIHVFSKTIRVTAWNTLLLRKKHGNFFDIFQRDFLKILKMASIAFSNLICLVCSQFSIYRFGSGTKWKIILSSFCWYWYLSTSQTRDIPLSSERVTYGGQMLQIQTTLGCTKWCLVDRKWILQQKMACQLSTS